MMKKLTVVSSLFFLTLSAVLVSGCEQSQEERLEDAVEETEDDAEEALDEMEDEVDDLSLLQDRGEHEQMAVNRYQTLVLRLDELQARLNEMAPTHQEELQPMYAALQSEVLQLGDRLSALKLAQGQGWADGYRNISGEFAEFAVDIVYFGDEMHSTVCPLHGRSAPRTLLASN